MSYVNVRVLPSNGGIFDDGGKSHTAFNWRRSKSVPSTTRTPFDRGWPLGPNRTRRPLMARCTVSRAILVNLPTQFTCELYKGMILLLYAPLASFLLSFFSSSSPSFILPTTSDTPPRPHSLCSFFSPNRATGHSSFILHTTTLSAGLACRMPSINPPYPSFTLVMSNNMGNSGTSRPSAYRGSHSGRYHPYPRAYPSHYEDHMVRHSTH